MNFGRNGYNTPTLKKIVPSAVNVMLSCLVLSCVNKAAVACCMLLDEVGSIYMVPGSMILGF
jgi:hypothetical protein